MVAGPTRSRFVALIANIAVIGVRTLYLFFSAKKLPRPDNVDPGSGYVIAKTMGSAV